MVKIDDSEDCTALVFEKQITPSNKKE